MLHWHVVKRRRILGTVESVLDPVDTLRGVKQKVQAQTFRSEI